MSNANLKRHVDCLDAIADEPGPNKKQKFTEEEKAVCHSATSQENAEPVCRLNSMSMWTKICSFLGWREHITFAELSRVHQLASKAPAAWCKRLRIHQVASPVSFILARLTKNNKEQLSKTRSLDAEGTADGRRSMFELNLAALFLPALESLKLRGLNFPDDKTSWAQLTSLRELSLADCTHYSVFSFLPHLPNLKQLRLELVQPDSPIPCFRTLSSPVASLTKLVVTQYTESNEKYESAQYGLMRDILLNLCLFPNLQYLRVCCHSDTFSLVGSDKILANVSAMQKRAGFEMIDLFCLANAEECSRVAHDYYDEPSDWQMNGAIFLMAIRQATREDKRVFFDYTFSNETYCLCQQYGGCIDMCECRDRCTYCYEEAD